MENKPHALRFGRVARLLLGAFLLIWAVPYLLRAPNQLGLPSLGVATGLAVFYSLFHLVIFRFFPGMNRWWGAIVANVFLAIMLILGQPGGLVFGRGEGVLGTVVFIGVSLVLAALRADSGCEMMTIPALLFKQHTHLVCILFSPIDWIERKVSSNETPV